MDQHLAYLQKKIGLLGRKINKERLGRHINVPKGGSLNFDTLYPLVNLKKLSNKEVVSILQLDESLRFLMLI